ncbi:hypothetical protein FKM95_000259 [Candidatus Tremblaya phenacola]|nr:hypothetical protein FKM95_000259 [Candidatus Tremblaya phenacola]
MLLVGVLVLLLLAVGSISQLDVMGFGNLNLELTYAVDYNSFNT